MTTTILEIIENNKAVFFNFDELLRFVDELKYHSLKNTLAKNIGLQTTKIPPEELKLFANGLDCKNTLKKATEDFLKKFGINEKLPSSFRNSFLNEKEDLTKKCNNVYLLLFITKTIKNKKVALVSNFSVKNKPYAAKKALKDSSIYGIFQRKLFIGQENALSTNAYQEFLDEQNVLKNEDEAPMALAMHKFKVKPEQTIVMVDNLKALKIAIRLGLTPIAYIALIIDEVKKHQVKEEMLALKPELTIFD